MTVLAVRIVKDAPQLVKQIIACMRVSGNYLKYREQKAFMNTVFMVYDTSF
jgi:hypothetical protein